MSKTRVCVNRMMNYSVYYQRSCRINNQLHLFPGLRAAEFLRRKHSLLSTGHKPVVISDVSVIAAVLTGQDTLSSRAF